MRITQTHIYIYLITNVSGHVRLEYVLSKIIYESKRIRNSTFINFLFILRYSRTYIYARKMIRINIKTLINILESWEKLNFKNFLSRSFSINLIFNINSGGIKWESRRTYTSLLRNASPYVLLCPSTFDEFTRRRCNRDEDGNS